MFGAVLVYAVQHVNDLQDHIDNVPLKTVVAMFLVGLKQTLLMTIIIVEISITREQMLLDTTKIIVQVVVHLLHILYKELLWEA